MALSETRFAVWLHDERIATLNRRDDYTWLTLADNYVANPERAVLGLVFEDNLAARHAGTLRLPNWFSNLLPEGRLRSLIAAERGVPTTREVELLVQVGMDLPGAVRVVAEEGEPDALATVDALEDTDTPDSPDAWRFSLAGIAIKFSMLQQHDKLRFPASGVGGDWIVKLPDPIHPRVPHNEFAMMDLAELAGLATPTHRLVARDELPAIPDHLWTADECVAYAVKRFDRGPNGRLVHIEDFAQVRNYRPDQKYLGTYETLASYIYRRRDRESLHEFVRRATFNILISNGDAHLKNWSLLYENKRQPVLSPVYDLVSTAMYAAPAGTVETMALKFRGTRRFERQRVSYFAHLGTRLGADGDELCDVARDTIRRVQESWPQVADRLVEAAPNVHDAVAMSIKARASTLLAPHG